MFYPVGIEMLTTRWTSSIHISKLSGVIKESPSQAPSSWAGWQEGNPEEFSIPRGKSTSPRGLWVFRHRKILSRVSKLRLEALKTEHTTSLSLSIWLSRSSQQFGKDFDDSKCSSDSISSTLRVVNSMANSQSDVEKQFPYQSINQ
jgi:hypothetical protein